MMDEINKVLGKSELRKAVERQSRACHICPHFIDRATPCMKEIIDCQPALQQIDKEDHAKHTDTSVQIL
jgi:hypothetical protein